MAFNAKDYEHAHSVGMDAMERLAADNVDEFSGVMAMLIVSMSAAYGMAPDLEAAEYCIDQARLMCIEELEGAAFRSQQKREGS